jgi:hypothetical protein
MGVVHLSVEHFVNPDGTMSSDAKTTLVLPNWTATLHHSYDDATDSYHHTNKDFIAFASSTSGDLLGKQLKVTHGSDGNRSKSKWYENIW